MHATPISQQSARLLLQVAFFTDRTVTLASISEFETCLSGNLFVLIDRSLSLRGEKCITKVVKLGILACMLIRTLGEEIFVTILIS